MNKLVLCALSMAITLNLTACATGGGYMTADLLGDKKTATFEEYKPLKVLPTQALDHMKALAGEYDVVNSWGNFTYGVKRVSFQLKDDKAYLLIYRGNNQIPTYKVEYSACLSSEDGNYLDIARNLGKQSFQCHNFSSRESPYLIFGTTTDNTVVEKSIEEMVTSVVAAIFSVKPTVKVNQTPYVMKFKIWNDASAPVLALKKRNLSISTNP
ncbi:hypothetical protein QG085_02695 [Kingella kingae]|uniref:hypothetical protein n=1 Tax=Kingella kingae TaxID=504 RepID=UPI000571486D|nr:hypothetical protein [Kingella kingae]MDK4544434.1 hypothetical protein [Kingella kingae]MDK4566341.1 hypothetical protein [Kingella kingae]MDK4590858.1 hypothetical protein [Kingella kingae]MDK4628106.1 hypothetical protein [Kingella kingae]MDK4635954.1 hypothetical protein [Kingella kingae]